ncbi:hypothetical protein OHA71_32955 [Streptomyces sp. NBC_00444]|uniref:hypothetical protein n=1 Tax=Streptomyces sp. NBC_00444 TaxID=2975744 RepID=UPI002E24D9E2
MRSVLEEVAPELAKLIPDDLGDRNLVSAVLLARLALADVQTAQIGQAIEETGRVLGPLRAAPAELLRLVGDAWRELRCIDHRDIEVVYGARLWSWELSDLHTGLLQYWAAERARELGRRFTRRGEPERPETGWPAVHRELRERWSLDSQTLWSGGFGPAPGPLDDWETLAEHARGKGDPVTARFMVDLADTSEPVQNVLKNMKAHPFPYKGSAHLVSVWEQSALAHAIASLAEVSLQVNESSPQGSLMPEDLQRTLLRSSVLGRGYQQFVVTDVMGRLTVLERTVIDRRKTPDMVREDQYLEQWIGWLTPDRRNDRAVPVDSEHLYALFPSTHRPAVTAPDWMAAVCDRRAAHGQVGWQGVLGTQLWWLYAIEGPDEIEAALQLHSEYESVFRVALDQPGTLVLAPAPDSDYADLLNMGFAYDSTRPEDMCRLLALARTGQVKLGFLVRDGRDVKPRMLRTIPVWIPAQLREAMTAHAMEALDGMVDGDPDALWDLLEDDSEDLDGSVESPKGAPSSGEWDGAMFGRSDTLF